MIELLVIAVVALLASALTLLSGFGLGTLLLPVFAWFLPLETAVAATALVHLVHNGWKAILVGRGAAWRLVVRFGVPAMLAAFAGAWVLVHIADAGVVAEYTWLGPRRITVAGLVVGTLIVVFSAFDLLPRLRALHIGPRWMVPGGLASGFFGGLSGHQGALRSAVLAKSVPTPSRFVATGVWCAIMVDVARLVVYGPGRLLPRGAAAEVVVASVAALVGALAGRRLLAKTTMDGVRILVGSLMVGTGLLVALGFV